MYLQYIDETSGSQMKVPANNAHHCSEVALPRNHSSVLVELVESRSAALESVGKRCHSTATCHLGTRGLIFTNAGG